MNLLLLNPSEVSQDVAIVSGPRLQHLRQVLGAGSGDVVRVGVLGAKMGTGTIDEINDERAVLNLKLDCPPPVPLELTLILALPRPHSLGKVLQFIAAVGCKEVILTGAARVQKSYWQSNAVSDEGLQRHLILGLEQGMDTVVPSVRLRPRFRPFVEDELPAICSGAEAFVAHPRADQWCPRSVSGPMVLVIGPEGGFVDFEISLLENAGLRTISFGPRPLRVEHAVALAVGRLG